MAAALQVLTSRLLDEAAGRFLFFKVEAFQRTGSFKFRVSAAHQAAGARSSRWGEQVMRSVSVPALPPAQGACNAVLKLSDEAAARGVVTHSSGNHAAALACAAQVGVALAATESCGPPLGEQPAPL